MSQDIEETRCKICGGILIPDKESTGFSKCAHCGNRFRMTQAQIDALKDITPNNNVGVFVSMSEKDVEKEKKQIKKNNAVYAIKGVMALMSVIIVGIFISLMTLYFKGNLGLKNIEIAIMAAIGVGIPMLMSIFTKVYANKKESLFLNIFMFVIFFAIFVVICYFAIAKYFILFI